MSPGEAADTIGWGPLFSLALAAAASLLGYGASNQRSKQTEADLDQVKRDHASSIKEAKDTAEKVSRDLVAYREVARDKFLLTVDFQQAEARLSQQIKLSHEQTAQKVEELRTEFGKKGIDHTINSAIQKGMAQLILEMKKRDH